MKIASGNSNSEKIIKDRSAKLARKSGSSVGKSAESEVLRTQLARALADYDNLRKRVDLEKEVWIKFSSERVLVKILPILDSLESAQTHLNDSGLAIVIGEFKKVLQEEGIEEIKPKVGDNFNPEFHEAVESVSGGKKGEVAELILSGCKFIDGKSLPAGRQVIRYAKVRVYGEKVGNEEELDKEMARKNYM